MKEFLKDLIIAVIIVAAITFVIKPTIVKESSMEDTLHENNYLFVNKMAYKFKDHPERGDIIVFKSDLDTDDGDGKKLLIKRVIAVEGDEISISDGFVYVNGQQLQEDYLKNEGATYDDEGMTIYDFQVTEGEIFCMGDNREVSLDSRSPSVGTVPEDAVVGKAFIRLFPFNQITLL